MKRPLCCVCAAFVVVVFLYLEWNPAPETIYDNPAGSRVTFCGEVYQKEYRGDTLVLYLRHIRDCDAASKIMCYVETDGMMAEPRSGSIAAVEGEVSYFQHARNPGGFDAREYYRILGVDFRLYKAKVLACGEEYSPYHEALYQIRRHFETVFDSVLSPKDSAVMKAVLLGRKTALDDESRQLFQKSGIAHIFAISGLHITILGMGLYRLLRKLSLPQFFCAAVSVCMMVVYGDMAGMSSSAYRAVFMFGMQLAARLLKRTYDMLTAVALAAVLILLEQPLYLHHSGFLLSFGAVLGIGCFGAVMKPEKLRTAKGLKGKQYSRLVYGIKSSLCGSLSIFMVHFPIMLCVYYTFPVYSFFLNLVIIPAMPLVMVCGLLCLAFGSIPAGIGLGMAKLAGVLCHVLLSAFDGLCKLSLKLPFADWIVGRPDNWRVYAFGAAMVFLYAAHCYGARLSKGKECERRGICIQLPFPVRLMTVLAAVVLISDSSIGGGASMTFLDVGQGDCIWVESAKGEHFLVDGGSASESRVGQYTIVPYLKYMGVSRLDAVFLTHLDSDHVSGVLEMLDSGGIGDGIAVDRICISDAVIEDNAYEKLAALCKAEGISLYRLKTGDRVTAYGLCFEALHPQGDYTASSKNAYSLVMKLEFTNPKTDKRKLTDAKESRKVTALLTGDVEADGESEAAALLAADFAGIDIYKAAHHGSRYSNTQELISAASPRLSVISCGEDNSYGHPHDETIERLRAAGSDILITKDTGAIMITIKKGNYTVKQYRRSGR